jgi:predicted metal-dependent hydrolase
VQETWLLKYEGKDYPCVVSYKRMRNIRFHFAKDGRTFCVSAPYGIARKSLQDSIDRFFPRLLKKMAYEPPVNGDEVFLFGQKQTVVGFSQLDEKAQGIFLKKKLLDFLTPAVQEYEARMGVEKPYQVRVRNMASRYGVNSQRTHRLTFTTSLVHYAPETIVSVVVHELGHDFVFNHSEKFYRIVYQYCPNYKALHAKLRTHHYE